MASESSEDLTVSVDLPADLVEWLDEEATTADVDRETAITQLLASYQTISKLDGDVDHESAQFDAEKLVGALEDGLSEKVEAEVEAAIEQEQGLDALDGEVAQRIDSVESTLSNQIDAVESSLTDRITSTESEIYERIEAFESEFDEKITDIRKRVVQLKKKTDEKAPKKHTHPEIAALDDLETDIDTLGDELDSLKADYKDATEQAETVEAHTERLDELQERLQTVAWVVSDLREERTKSELDAVDRIKHAAAKADIKRAKCENCKEGVQISLMTEPRCPHCEATLSNVEPASGWFGDPTLTVPSQLESGEDS